nr:hypothetical protein [Methanoregulaceae archaeon]
MRRELIAIIVTAALLIGAAVSQSSWYPRSDNYTTTGWFVGDGLYLSGDGIIDGNLTVTGAITNTALDERIGAIEDDVGDVTNMTTTATDLAGAIDELDAEIGDISTLDTTEKGSVVGAINELDGRVDAVESPPMWHVQTITTPEAAASDEVLDETDGAITTDGTNIDADNMTGTIDAARCLILTPGVSMTGDALLTGTNVNDEDITETINWEANANATTTAQAFKALTWANFTTDTNTSVTIGYSDKLGLSVIPDDADAVMFTFLGGVMETTLPTVTIGATVAECSADLASALTGTA